MEDWAQPSPPRKILRVVRGFRAMATSSGGTGTTGTGTTAAVRTNESEQQRDYVEIDEEFEDLDELEDDSLEESVECWNECSNEKTSRENKENAGPPVSPQQSKSSPPKIGVSPSHHLRQPEAAQAVAGQYDFTWLESPADRRSENRRSPRNVYHGRSLFGRKDHHEKAIFTTTTPRPHSLGRAFTAKTAKRKTASFETPSNDEHQPAPDPHLKLLELLWPSATLDNKRPTPNPTKRPDNIRPTACTARFRVLPTPTHFSSS